MSDREPGAHENGERRLGDRRTVRVPAGAPKTPAPKGKRPRQPARPPSPRKASMRRGANVALAAVLLAGAVGATVLAWRLPAGQQAQAARVAEPYSSRWLCPVLPTSGGSVAIANTGSSPTALRATISWTDKADTRGVPTARALATGGPLPAGAARPLRFSTDQPSLLEVESFGAPTLVTASGQAPCATAAAARWWLSVADTVDGDTDVILANPSRQGAVVQLILHTTDKAYPPQKLRRLFIPARSAITQSLGEYPSLVLSVQVEVLLGRVVAGAVTKTGGSKRTMVVPGQPGAQAVWSFAGGRGGRGDLTQVALTNPGLDPLVVDVRVVTGKDAFTPPGFEDLEIPSGATKRVPLDVNVPGGGAMGVEVRSRTGSPFAAALLVTPRGTSPYLDIGVSQTWDSWVLPKLDGTQPVAFVNLSADPVNARVADLGRAGDPAIPVPVPPDRIVVKELRASKGGLLVEARGAGLVVAPLGDLAALPVGAGAAGSLAGPVLADPSAG